MQLTRGMPGRVGHHWRTKCALSGYHGGKGNGFRFSVCGGGVEFEFVSDSVSRASCIGPGLLLGM